MGRAVGAWGFVTRVTWGVAPCWYQTDLWPSGRNPLNAEAKSKTSAGRATCCCRVCCRVCFRGRWNCAPPAPTARPQTSLGQRPRYQPANITRAEGPFHHHAVSYLSQHARCHPDEPRRWRSRFVWAGDMGRRPRLVLGGPLALVSDAPWTLGEQLLVTIPGALPQAGINRAVGPNCTPCRNR
jgi:hypothetical protein